jgi:hypothetical protein
METKGTQQSCDTTQTVYTNSSSTTLNVTVEVKDRCLSDGSLIVYNKSNVRVRTAPIPYGSTLTVLVQVPGNGRIDLDCNGAGGTGEGCICNIAATIPAIVS